MCWLPRGASGTCTSALPPIISSWWALNWRTDPVSIELERMQILFIGDIFGSPGRRIVRDHLGHVVETNKVDLVIANAENSAGGFGLTPAIADELFDLGCHVLTTGNHIWDKREIVDYFNSANGDPSGRARKVLRPANYAEGVPGVGVYEGCTAQGHKFAVINLQGRVFM